MSVRHVGLVLDHLEASPGVKLVAMILADHADADGVCWPSYRRVAQRSCLGERTVRRYVRELIERGIVTKLNTGRGPAKGETAGGVYRPEEAAAASKGPPREFTVRELPGEGSFNERVAAWYAERLGLVTSDEIALDESTVIGAFLRCDQGDRFVDHHTLFLLGAGTAGFNHAAFEVADLDDLMAGNTHLVQAGYTHQWGIGRHILGSQIYDYWLDPWGHMVEHWTDGDLFNNQNPPNTASIAELIGSQWGPTEGGPPG